MKTYELQSGTFESNVRITFNDNGIMVLYEVMNPELTNVQAGETRIPVTEAKFKELAQQYKFQYTEVVDQEISFEQFYEKYGYKVDKQPALKIWNKMSKQNQIKAFNFIWTYDRQLIRDKVKKKYPSTYLNSEIYL